MFPKTFLFLISFVTVPLFTQIRDSVLNDDIPYSKDSTEMVITDTVKNTIDSLITISETASHPLYYQPFSYQSTFIRRTDILRNDYRYTGDLFKLFPFSFERSYGFIGQPNDIYLYGERSNATNYFIDGVPISSTLFYSLDFNHIQNEDIDSIEIIPLPRGFLYGFATNPVSVNFITRGIIPTKPYSRIKYYEGPFGEAFIDGIFSMHLFKDIIASVEITNRKVDDSYKNSAFSIWQLNSKLRYILSDDVNLIGSYYFSKSETGINGGVNVDEIKRTTADINSVLYNETLASVYYDKNSLDFKQHNLGLKILAKPFENAFTDLNIYYKFSLEEYQKIYTGYDSKTAIKNKIFGITIDQRVQLNNLHFNLMAGYQNLKYNPAFYSSNPSVDPTYYLIGPPTETKSLFLSPQIKIPLLNNKLIPSIYGKLVNKTVKNIPSEMKTSESLGGFGADLLFNVTDQFNLYVGYSKFDDMTYQIAINLSEVRLTYYGENYNTILMAFSKKQKSTSTSGVALSGHYKYWKILFEGRFSQYFYEQGNTYEYFNLPKTNASLGVFIRDTFFNLNLDLKAGLQMEYTGKQNLDFLIIPYKGFESDDVPSSFTIDFTLTAEIQKAAIVYFTWENLLNKKYYITPYYPMLGRNIRFGVAWEILN